MPIVVLGKPGAISGDVRNQHQGREAAMRGESVADVRQWNRFYAAVLFVEQASRRVKGFGRGTRRATYPHESGAKERIAVLLGA